MTTIKRMRSLAVAGATAVMLVAGPSLAHAQSYEQQRMQNQTYQSQQNLQRSSDQLNRSLQNSESQINNRANTQSLQQRQTIQNMQQNLQPRPNNGLNTR